MSKKPKQRLQRAPIVVPRHEELATPPGTIAPPPGTPEPILQVIGYGTDGVWERGLDDISPLGALLGSEPVLWVNIDGVGDASIFKDLGQLFGIHQLVLEDVVNFHQRPKAEDYETHAYVVLQTPYGDDGLPFEQMSLLVGKNYVITVGERPGDCLDPVRQRIRAGRGRIRRAGPDYLAYAVMDAVIDNYFPVVERINARLEVLEGYIVQSPDEDTIAEVHAIRHDLHTLRRALAPTREALGLLIRGETGPFGEETRVFLRDCQDHTAQLLDAVEACRELSAGLMDLHASAASHRLNERMTVLTMIATIFIPLSFIAGLYGMNFDHSTSPWNMPELTWAYGYPFALALMLGTAVGILIFFRRRGWLGGTRKLQRERLASDRAAAGRAGPSEAGL